MLFALKWHFIYEINPNCTFISIQMPKHSYRSNRFLRQMFWCSFKMCVYFQLTFEFESLTSSYLYHIIKIMGPKTIRKKLRMMTSHASNCYDPEQGYFSFFLNQPYFINRKLFYWARRCDARNFSIREHSH